jgi:hypothetical protein
MKHGMAAPNVPVNIERKKKLTHLMNLIQKNDREQALEYIFTPEFQTKLQAVLDVKDQITQIKSHYQALHDTNIHLAKQLAEYQIELDNIKKSFLSAKGGSEDS